MDRDIVNLLKKKDQRAINLMQERYEKLIYYIANTVLAGRESAVEECVNDVYLKIWVHGAGYDYKKASFKTYIKVITRNTALNHLRTIRHLETHEQSDESEDIQEEYIDYRQNPEHGVIRKEEVQVLENLLRKLKSKDRELVIRRFYYLQSSKQIALAMKMTENAVDSKLSRLRKKIKEHFEREVAK